MKETLRTLWTYLAIGLFALGLAVIYGVVRSSVFNVYVLGVGILLLIPAIISMIIVTIGPSEETTIANLKELKASGLRIAVDLIKCRIVTNSWTQTRPEKKDGEIVVNALTDNSYENRTTDEAVLSRVICTCVVNGKKRTFRSPTIARDKVTLKLLLEAQKETNIYVDRDDARYYYFDLEFAH